MKISLNTVQCKLFGGQSISITGNIEIYRGIPVVLTGANGSGKTLTLNLISSILEEQPCGIIKSYDTDAMVVDSREQLSEQRVAWLQQEPRDNFISRCSSDEVILPLLSAGLTRDQMYQRLTSLLYKTDLFESDILSRRISQLSGGERQKLGLLAALAASPDYLLLDEPFSRLDTSSQIEVGDLLKRHCKNRNVLVATQDVERYAEVTDANSYYEVQVKSDFSKNITLKSIKNTLLPSWRRQSPEIHRDELTKVVRYLSPEVTILEVPKRGVEFVPGNGQTIFDAKLVEVAIGQNVLARSAEPILRRGLNFALGENGSGKTLFGTMFTGQIPINPIFRTRNRVIARLHMNGHVEQTFDIKSWWKHGLSTHLHSEPDLFLTERFVEDELKMFGTFNDEFSRRMLEYAGVTVSARTNELSYGQRKAVSIACLPNNLELAILDEPFSGFSSKMLKILGDLVEGRLKNGHWRCCLILTNRLDQLVISFQK
jgi:energy-coupling factor transporter ATP-binding protein EcfA2